MTDIGFDGTWTLIMADEEADPDTNEGFIVNGGKAWKASSPESIGTCLIWNGFMTIMIRTRDSDGATWTETLIAKVVDGPTFSATLNVTGPDDVAFSDACTLVRGLDLHAKPKTEWSEIGAYFSQSGRAE